MTNKLFILFLALISINFNVLADDEENVKKFKASTLIGVLWEEDPSIIKKLEKKPAELALYKSTISKTNENFKKVLGQYWKMHSKIEYKTLSEIEILKEAIAKDKKNKGLYAFIRMDYYSYYKRRPEESQILTAKEYTSDINYLKVYLLDGTELTYSSLPNVVPTVPDLIYGVRHVYNTIIGMEFGKDLTALTEENCPQLRDKTLLLTKEQVGELEAKDLIKSYPFPYKIVTQAEIDNAVLSSDPQSAYLVSADQSDSVVMKMLVLTSTGQWAGYLVNNGRTALSKAELKNLTKSCK